MNLGTLKNKIHKIWTYYRHYKLNISKEWDKDCLADWHRNASIEYNHLWKSVYYLMALSSELQKSSYQKVVYPVLKRQRRIRFHPESYYPDRANMLGQSTSLMVNQVTHNTCPVKTVALTLNTESCKESQSIWHISKNIARPLIILAFWFHQLWW